MLRSLTTAWQYLPESSARDNVVFNTEPAKVSYKYKFLIVIID